VVEH